MFANPVSILSATQPKAKKIAQNSSFVAYIFSTVKHDYIEVVFQMSRYVDCKVSIRGHMCSC